MSRTFTFERSLIRRTYGPPPPPPSLAPPPNCDEPVPLKLEPPGYSDEDPYLGPYENPGPDERSDAGVCTIFIESEG
jgi:hypothetical protein